jgi:5-(carboxyamino)imidazole ribonucleotide synthase
MILPGKTLGVLGGGQLGRMFAHAAERLGYHVHIYEPSTDSPAAEVSAHAVHAPYTDLAALESFVRACDVVTYEFENIPTGPLLRLESAANFHPKWQILEIAQNRLREKTWLRKNEFPHVRFAECEADGDLEAAIRSIGLPCVVKTADFGYDGKGQQKVTDDLSLARAVAAFKGQRAVVERWVNFRCELSVIVARSTTGETRCFPVAENIHTRHILDFSILPARIAPAVQDQARALAVAIAERLGLTGLLAVELFLTDDGELLVNEMAPRPHNSGHWTLDGCVTSQFEQHVRAVAGLPLGDVGLTAPAVVMVNILGDAWKWSGDHCIGEPNWAALLATPQAHLHLYGKKEPRKARKMGHFTVTADDTEAALDLARKLQAAL